MMMMLEREEFLLDVARLVWERVGQVNVWERSFVSGHISSREPGLKIFSPPARSYNLSWGLCLGVDQIAVRLQF